MEKLFSTKDVQPRNRFDYWHEVACRKIIKHDSQPQCRVKFRAALQTGMLANVELILFQNSPMNVAHDRRHIEQAADDGVLICRQVRGALALEQNGREVLLEPGDFTVLDPLLPYVGKFPYPSSMLILKVPRRTLEARVGKTSEMVARSRKLHAGGSLASSYLATLPTHTEGMLPGAEEIVRDHALDLVGLSLNGAIRAKRRCVLAAKATPLDAEKSVTARNTLIDGSLQWSNADLFFLVDSVRHGMSLLEIAGFLGKDEAEVWAKARELKLAIPES